MALNSLYARAVADDQFRQQLKADPCGAAKAAGVELPAGASLEVLEDDAHTAHFVVTDDTSCDSLLIPEALRVINRARRDPAFKALGLRDPRAAVQEALGLDLPDSLNVVVVEDTLAKVHLVLPAGPLADGEMCNGELSDEELALVAGGISTVSSDGKV